MVMSASSYRYQTGRSDEPLRTQLVELARSKPRYGYRRLHVLLQRGGERVNHKRVHRVYREAGLMIRRKKRKHCEREGKPLAKRILRLPDLEQLKTAVLHSLAVGTDRVDVPSFGRADCSRERGRIG